MQKDIYHSTISRNKGPLFGVTASIISLVLLWFLCGNFKPTIYFVSFHIETYAAVTPETITRGRRFQPSPAATERILTLLKSNKVVGHFERYRTRLLIENVSGGKVIMDAEGNYTLGGSEYKLSEESFALLEAELKDSDRRY